MSPIYPPAMSEADPRLHDPVALAEIELYGDVVIAATASPGPLPRDQLDALLGVRPVPRGSVPAARSDSFTSDPVTSDLGARR
jgi:hypothetical protein